MSSEPEAHLRERGVRPRRPGPGFLAALAGVCFALAALLALPRPGRGAPSEPAVQLVLLDVSDSARAGRPGWLSWARGAVISACEVALERGESVHLVAFARGARTLMGPRPAEEVLSRVRGNDAMPLELDPPGMETSGSRLDLGLGLGRTALLDPLRFPGRCVVITDGFDGSASPGQLAELRALGVAVELRPYPEATATELALLDVRAPRQVDVGRPVGVELEWARLAGPWPKTIEVEVRWSSTGDEGLQRVSLSPPAGVQRWRCEVVVPGQPAGPLRLDARWIGADALPGNHSGSARLMVGEARSVALVVDDSRRAGWERELAWLPEQLGLEGAGDRSGTTWSWGAPGEIADQIEQFDLLILLDVPPDDFPRGRLARWVRDGGGLLALAGERMLRPDPAGDGFDLLPLVPAPPDRPPREVALLMDGSGSMEGEPFEAVRSAALELIGALPVGDRLTLRLFTRAPTRPIVLADSNLRNRAEAARKLQNLRVPGGATEILSSMEAMLERRYAAGDRQPCLLILMSDGREEGLVQVGPRLAALAERCAERDIERYAVGVGDRANLKHLERLVGAPERVVEVERLEQLREALLKAVQSERMRPGPIPLVARVQGPLAEALEFPSEWPSLERFTTARLAEGATLMFTDDRGAPGGALWRVGAGRVASLLGGPLPEWGSSWAGRGDLLAELVRFLSAAPEAEWRAQVEAGGVRLVGVPAEAPLSFNALGRGLDDGRGDAVAVRLEFGPTPGRVRAAERWAPWPTGASAPSDRAGSALRIELPTAEWSSAPGAGRLVVQPPVPAEWRGAHPPIPEGAAGPGAPPRALPLARIHPWAVPLGSLGLLLLTLALAWRPSAGVAA